VPPALEPVTGRGAPAPTLRLAALLALAALSAAWWGAAAASGIGLAVVAAGAVDALVARRTPTVRRTVPGELVRGVRAPWSVAVERSGPGRTEVRQPQTADLRFEPAEGTAGIDGTVVALSRGRHELAPVVVRTIGPLGLARRDLRVGSPQAVVAHADLPAARRLAMAVRQGRFRDPGLRRGPLGLGTDFESIREYSPDDDVRRINWAATERVGRPMANRYREDTERDLWCLVDAGRLSASPVGDRTRLDAALDALAAVGAVADVVGDRIGAVVFDDEVRRTIPPRRAGAAALVRLLDEVEPSIVDSDHEGAFAQVAGRKRSLVVVFTDLLDGAAARPLLAAMPALVRRHAVLVVQVSDPDLVRAVTEVPSERRDLLVASVASELLAEQDAVRARLRSMGAVALEAPVDGLASACVAAYLRLKSLARI
jgi:uncharacterized protein (DUF58 family)